MNRENPISVAPAPQPRSDRRGLAIALGLLAAGLGVLVLVLGGAWRALTPPASPVPAPPPIVLGVAISSSAPAPALAPGPGAIVASPPTAQQARQQALLAHRGAVEVPVRWEAGFYAVYAEAQRTFAVNWLLLASVHKQETAFSTAPGTYHGLNSAHCCAGPMQFNVRNGPRTTWQLVMGAYRFGARPSSYNHPTARHPSTYDDFDSIMAAAWLLSSDGASMQLNGSAWQAAYDYYGHDAIGVSYADQVLARAIGWSQTGFCPNCALRQDLVDAVDAAYGAPARAQLAVVAAPHPAAARRSPVRTRPPASRAVAARAATAPKGR